MKRLGFSVVRSASTVSAPRILYGVSKAETHDVLPSKHPECAARITAIEEKIESTGYLTSPEVQRLKDSEIVLATAEQISAVHNQKYFEVLQQMVDKLKGKGPKYVDGDTYVTEGSLEAALKSSGIGIQIADRIAAASKSGAPPPVGFVLARPPGHHAIPKGAMGFCVFSTISIIARHCQQTLGYKRVAIVDFDVHHGNGTQDAFYEDPDVLFISTHQKGGFPGTGKMSEVGSGSGEGYNVNLVLPGDAGDSACRAGFEEVVLPAITRFQPDIILVSAGFDAHWRDPLAGLQYRTSTFHYMTTQLKQLADTLCGGRLIFSLEGGYDLKGLSESVVDCFQAALGKESLDRFNPDLLRDEPSDKVREAILECRSIHGL